MFALFNLGAQELLILLAIGVMLVGIPVAVFVLILVLGKRGKGRDDSGGE